MMWLLAGSSLLAVAAGFLDDRLALWLHPAAQTALRAAGFSAFVWRWNVLTRSDEGPDRTAQAAFAAVCALGFFVGRRLRAVGVTGAIASGKSAVSRALEDRGLVVIDADRVARDTQGPGSDVVRRLVDRFGPDIVDESGVLDRRRLGAKVFGDPSALGALNRITHPPIARKMAWAFFWQAVVWGRSVAVDAALLSSSAVLLWLCSPILVVTASAEVRIRRIVGRDGLTHGEAEERVRAQLPEEEILRRAGRSCIHISNEGTLAELEERAGIALRLCKT